jgi:hypothetical protein
MTSSPRSAASGAVCCDLAVASTALIVAFTAFVVAFTAFSRRSFWRCFLAAFLVSFRCAPTFGTLASGVDDSTSSGQRAISLAASSKRIFSALDDRAPAIRHLRGNRLW